jgi:hypothetical protein
MLTATPRGLFTGGFTVQEGGDTIADIDPSWFGERAEIRAGGQTYSAYRESLLAGTFVLQSGERALARALKALVLLSHRSLPCVPARAAQRASGPNTPGPLRRRPPLARLAPGRGMAAAGRRLAPNPYPGGNRPEG